MATWGSNFQEFSRINFALISGLKIRVAPTNGNVQAI